MNKKMFLTALQYFFNILAVVSIIVLLIIFENDELGYYITLWIIMALSIINIVLIGFKEYLIKEYDSGKYTLIMHATYCVINCGAYYLVKYVNGYETYFYLYWLLSYLSSVIVVIMFMFFNKHAKNNKPNFRINKDR